MYPKNPLARTIASGVKANGVIGELISSLGTNGNADGSISAAYRTARLALKSALGENDPRAETRGIFKGLRRTLEREVRETLQRAQQFGFQEAERQLRYYGIGSSVEKKTRQANDYLDVATDAVMATLDSQLATIDAMIVTGDTTDQIIGEDEDAPGIFRSSIVIASAADWIGGVTWGEYESLIGQITDGFQRQAIAALDERTTPCCLAVNGQIVGMDQPFQTLEPPAYAPLQDNPPFHRYCRTSVGLYRPEFDDGLTDRMRSEADMLIEEKQAGGSGYRHPANSVNG